MKIATLLLLAGLVMGQDQTGSVVGVVTDAVTHQPVKKATVMLNFAGGVVGVRAQDARPPSAITDLTGSFSMNNVTPGKYQVTVQHQNYPPAQNGPVRKTIEVKAGEKAGPIELELIPPAVVTGHVLDEDGDPMNGCSVEARRVAIGNQRFGVQSAPALAEDGAYRLHEITPGKYILAARCQQPAFQARPFSQGPDAPPSAAYPVQYYSATVDPKSAQAVELAAGSEKAGIEFRMSPAAVTQVRGTWGVGGGDLRDRSPLTVGLVPVEDQLPSAFDNNRIMDREKGTFEFRQVFPGSYMLMAFTNGNAEGRIGAVQRVEVKDTPVETVINLSPAMNVEGTIQIEGNNSGTSQLAPAQCNVQLISVYRVPGPNGAFMGDGIFSFAGVLPGPWRLRVNCPNGFLKSAWLGTTEVTDGLLDLSSGTAGGLKLVISTNTATIRGTGPPGQVVYAHDFDPAILVGNYRAAQVDQSGQFKLEGLAPGTYRVGATESDGPMPEEGGQEITVHERETLTIDVKARSN